MTFKTAKYYIVKTRVFSKQCDKQNAFTHSIIPDAFCQPSITKHQWSLVTTLHSHRNLRTVSV